MKNSMARILSVGLLMAGVVSLHAQPNSVSANVPFNFYVGKTAMPKGFYKVSENRLGGVLTLKSDAKIQSITAINTTRNSGDSSARLVFHRIGDTYFLAQVWTGYDAVGRALPRTARERELSAQLSAPATTEIVALAQ